MGIRRGIGELLEMLLALFSTFSLAASLPQLLEFDSHYLER
jgi:hypothetical protein